MTASSLLLLANAAVAAEVWERHPDYVALLMTVDGIQGGESDAASDLLLREAESITLARLTECELEQLPEIQVWRAAFADFGVKPRVARSSVESLMRRTEAGLPRVDRLTDLYNAISLKHLVPIGGEDLDAYAGSPQLVVANGSEAFDTLSDGQLVDSPPPAGEIAWRDEAGVTCRRWNWRQCVRTRLNPQTSRAIFIFDGLGVGGRERAEAAATELREQFTQMWPDATVNSRLLSL